MAKAKYAPGELNRLRDRLGVSDKDEALKLAQLLGGEVGSERPLEMEKDPRDSNRGQIIRNRPKRTVELSDDEDGYKVKLPGRQRGNNSGDDSIADFKSSYWERVRLDRFAAQPEFEIKSPGQVFSSVISFFNDANDFVNPFFVTRRMPEYYKKLEILVIATRNVLPRNNTQRNEKVKKSAPAAYAILDTIRHWEIEKISSELAKIQARPKNVKVSELVDMMKAFYKPIFILNRLDLDIHIRGAYKTIYKILYIENPNEAKEKYQDPIRTAVIAFTGIRRDTQYLLYPLLLKLVSPSYVNYEEFFELRKNRLMTFLGVDERSQINPDALFLKGDSKNVKPSDEPAQDEAESGKQQDSEEEEEKPGRNAEEGERKALERGLQTLETIFPRVGWEKISSWPDLYPYFVDVLGLRNGMVNIAPTDPMQHIYILMRILEELFFGLRHVRFGFIRDSSGRTEKLDSIIVEIINDWHSYIEVSFEKGYLPQMTEYVRILEGSIEERNSPYSKKIVSELHWIKRLYLLPYYKFEFRTAPPIQKSDVIQIYTKIKILRKYLGIVAANIEQGKKAGGAEANANCDAIENPWAPYTFQIPNPVSKRLDALLKPKIRNNASLVFFCLAVTAVLDFLMNSEDSWAYSASRPLHLFRSVNGEGLRPYTGVDHLVDADELFRQAIKQRQKTE